MRKLLWKCCWSPMELVTTDPILKGKIRRFALGLGIGNALVYRYNCYKIAKSS